MGRSFTIALRTFFRTVEGAGYHNGLVVTTQESWTSTVNSPRLPLISSTSTPSSSRSVAATRAAVYFFTGQTGQ